MKSESTAENKTGLLLINKHAFSVSRHTYIFTIYNDYTLAYVRGGLLFGAPCIHVQHSRFYNDFSLLNYESFH